MAGRADSGQRAGNGRTPAVTDPAHVRNVVLVGPSGAGKTTLVEALLAHTGVIPRQGTVLDGTTVCDHDPAAVRQQRSVALSVAPFVHDETKINLIDTPGYGDFVGELRAGLRAADAALFVIPASEGHEGAVDPATGTGPRLMGGAYEFENRQTSADGYLNGPFTLFGRRHEALIGVNHLRTSTEQFSANFLTPVGVPVDVWKWDPHSVPEPAVGPYASRGPTRMVQSGIYAMGRFSLADPLKLVLGGRVSRWKQNTSSASSRLSSEFTPYGGLVLDISPQWALYASYAQVFQPQTQTTWEGGILDPVQGSNREVGIKGGLLDGRLDASLALFNIRQRNRAQSDPAHPCAGAVCYYIAGGEVESRGIEAEVNGRIMPGLDLSLGYTYNATEYLKDAQSQGQPFARFTPKHIFRLWANTVLPGNDGRLSAGVGLQAQSAYTVQSGGVTLRQGGYALASLRIGYRINKHLSAALHVNNLFDRRYYQSLSGTSWNNRYGEPRSVALTLRMEY